MSACVTIALLGEIGAGTIRTSVLHFPRANVDVDLWTSAHGQPRQRRPLICLFKPSATELERSVPKKRFLNSATKIVRRLSWVMCCAGLSVSIFQICNPAIAQQNVPFDFQEEKRSASSAKVVHSRLDGFGIPFKIDDQNGKFIEVQLYSSSNQGETWEFLARQPIDGTEFPFRARGEGEYWFALKTLDRNRRLLPEGEAQPELKIIVDTTRPELEFFVDTDRAGRVVCRWQAADRFLDAEATRLQYRAMQIDSSTSKESPWQDVALNPPQDLPGGIYSDQLAFWPDTETGQLEMRMAAVDQAGNFTVANRKTNVRRPAWRASTRATARPYDQPAVDPGNVPSTSADVRSMTCKDGLCRIDGDDRSEFMSDETAWKQAFYSKLRRQENRRNNAPMNSFVDKKASSPDQRPSDHVTYQPPRVGGGASSAHLAVETQRTASTRGGVPAMLIGSEPEFAAPPVPEGWIVPAPNNVARPVVPDPVETFSQSPVQSPLQSPSQSPVPRDGFPQPNDVSSHRFPEASPYRQPSSDPREVDVWESAVHRNENDVRESVSSTNRPERSMLPLPSSSGRRTGSADAVVANPNTFRAVGDRAIGASSTQWPRNQYQGLTPDRNATAAPAEMAPAVPNEIFRSNRSAPAMNMNWPSGQATPSRESAPVEKGTSFRSVSAPMADLANRNSPQNQMTAQPRNLGRPSVNGPTKANTQIISTKRFRLSYDIDAIDPSGVGKVDLWMTVDQGRSWKLWGSDPDNTSPFPVEVQQEGLYGFRVVIHSREGLAGSGPSSGDDADMWVRVDTQSPLAQITSVPYGRGNEAGRLVINYRVADPFLTLRPVRLSYSRSPQGPWTIIEDDLRNEGRYVWKVSRVVPDRIFLKIDALDSAGNVGTHLLPQAIDVSGLVPRGTIHAVEPVGR